MMKKPGYIIEIEGGDGAGKKTQTDLLRRRLAEAGWEVLVYSFPDDSTPYGRLIRSALNGEHGDFRHADPYLSAALYMADRGIWSREIAEARERGAIVILDRGPFSNFAFQGAKIDDRHGRDALQAWCERMEFDQLHFPHPDLVLFLDVPSDISEELMGRRGVFDQHEVDEEYQRAVHEEFVHLAHTSDWAVIDCSGSESVIASREVIHKRIWEIVHAFLAQHE